MPAKQTLIQRQKALKGKLGVLAYERQEHTLRIEAIDKDVAQMEAQFVLIEATLLELNEDERSELAQKQKDLEDAKQKRRAKYAAEKRKGPKAKETKATPREG